MESLGRTLMVAGIVLAVLGVVLYVSPSIPLLGRLPGDLRIERPGFRFYFPITSCLLVSAAISGVLWLVSKLR
jgi:hypothetical protein